MKKCLAKIVIISLLTAILCELLVTLSGCSFLDVYFRTKHAGDSVYGIPTGVYDLIEEDKTKVNSDLHWLNVSNKIDFAELSFNICQGDDGKIYLGSKKESSNNRQQIVYLYEEKILVYPYQNEVLHYKKSKSTNIDNYGIPKGTYNLVDGQANNIDIPTQLVVDNGIEIDGDKYIFSQDDDGIIRIIMDSSLRNKKRIIYFYEKKLLDVHWDNNIILHFTQK